MDTFTYSNQWYKQDLSPIKSSIQQYTTYISKKLDIPLDKAKSLVVQEIKENKDKYLNPIVKYYERQDNEDKIIKKIPLSNYIETVKMNDEIIVPSFTAYINSKKRVSFHKKFVLNNLKSRAQEKKLAFKYYSIGDIEKATYHDIMQKTKKIFNNSLSGAYASKSTILYNPSAHYTLTSITRSVASIGNAITESIVMGNRYYNTMEAVLNHFTALITYVDKDIIREVIDKYKLKIPSYNDVMDMVIYNIEFYWRSKEKEDIIFDYILSMSDIDRAIVMYVNDLYHLHKLNPERIENFIRRLSSKEVGGSIDNFDILKNAPEDVLNLMHHICREELEGIEPNYEQLKKSEVINVLIATTENIINVLKEYELLIKGLFATPVMPNDIVDMKDMTRRAIVLSDTDSTCASYDHWVKVFYGKTIFNTDATAISASVMFLTAGSLRHYLRILAANMNVPEDSIHMLAMKNEFYWDVFNTANLAKTYFSNTIIKEGVVFKEPKLELKGSNLVASGIPLYYHDKHQEMLVTINKEATSNDKISINKWLKYVADLERDILNKIKDGNIEPLTMVLIKDKNVYKQDEYTSIYYHYHLWENVFRDKYGEAGDIPCNVVEVPTILDNKNKVLKYIEDIEDEALRERFRKFFTEHPKGSLGNMKVPLQVAVKHGIPKEIYDIINVHKVVTRIMKPFYITLEILGFYIKKDKILIDMGY